MTEMFLFYGMAICMSIFAIAVMIKIDYNAQPIFNKVVCRLAAGVPLILSVFIHMQADGIRTPQILFLIAISFFVLGDVLINFGMAFGLVSFLIGHLVFGSGIISAVGKYFHPPQLWGIGAIMAALILWYVTNYYKDVASKDKILGIASVVYVASLSFAAAVMLPLMVATGPIATIAGIGFTGYISFYASDIELVVNAFIKPVRNDFIINSVLYYTGLILLVIFTLFI